MSGAPRLPDRSIRGLRRRDGSTMRAAAARNSPRSIRAFDRVIHGQTHRPGTTSTGTSGVLPGATVWACSGFITGARASTRTRRTTPPRCPPYFRHRPLHHRQRRRLDTGQGAHVQRVHCRKRPTFERPVWREWHGERIGLVLADGSANLAGPGIRDRPTSGPSDDPSRRPVRASDYRQPFRATAYGRLIPGHRVSGTRVPEVVFRAIGSCSRSRGHLRKAPPGDRRLRDVIKSSGIIGGR